ncbi:3-phosphoshikimate 1-carboxyvinyltransferase [Acetanaerobacterium elongatum]|uniref:3-phosphoshikimate 1-carboxyvinyltransferase n=1 Tax=Acetanaerobacterium elongatum TaxID=258515 RepID=A0A1H0EPI3_9FIRM|nr:3-phosphoshikimate 1-carboxyvinyltransferase [Acetanaerobacterium elongatum]SDN84213.1 3-phosphoshikimate 1-carboxyvinyltransferase [Acetanaerobacterium elongatum]
MDKIVHPSSVSGRFQAPSSKSASHRAVIAAALAGGESYISGLAVNDDIAVTIKACEALGAQIERDDDSARIIGIVNPPNSAGIHCGESGSTLRFMLPIAAALGVNAVFTGEGRLPGRPIHMLVDELCRNGITTDYAGNMPFSISENLNNGTYRIGGGVSSQFVTGLLFALPLLSGDSEIIIEGRLESKPYVDMTVSTLKAFGITVEEKGNGYSVKGNQRYTNCNIRVEGDYSGAAFLLAAAALSGEVGCEGLSEDSLQGDRAILPLLERFGAQVSHEAGMVTVKQGRLRGIEIDAADIPDLVPVLAVIAACAKGTTIIKGAARLRIKESDRLASVSAMLGGFGADITQTDDGFKIIGKPELTGGEAQSFGDHRIAMSAAVAALRCKGPVVIRGAECVSKSYPDFFEVLQSVSQCRERS